MKVALLLIAAAFFSSDAHRRYQICITDLARLAPPTVVSKRKLPDNAQEAVQEIRKLLGELSTKGDFEKMGLICRIGGCINSSSLLKEILELHGFFPKRFEVAENTPLEIDGKRQAFTNLHFFLVIAGGGTREEIIIDGTYLQFLNEGENVHSPPLFIGTRKELVDLFREHQNQMAIGPRNYSKMDAEEFVGRLYGFGKTGGRRIARDD